MLRLVSEIQIGTFKITNINDIEVDSSWENLTDTCKIILPRNINWRDKNITEVIKRGDKVLIKVGYDDENVEIFQGYVRDVSGQIPITITCEDAMYLLKKGEINKVYSSVTTAKLIHDIVGAKVPYKVVADATLGSFRIKRATPAKVLEYLRSNYFQKAWFRFGKLYVGLAYYPALQKEHNFDFNEDIHEDHSLEFRIKEDVQIALKGVIMYANNKKKEVKFGDEEGEQRTFHYYEKTEAFVRQSLKQEIERLKYTGYKGSFATFGMKVVRHGDIVILHDRHYPERAGKYLVKKVTYKFGFAGFHQTIELEAKV